jgi:hypothetical protein
MARRRSGRRSGRHERAEYARHYNAIVRTTSNSKNPRCESGHAVDITAWIERRQVLGGVISEYRRAA